MRAVAHRRRLLQRRTRPSDPGLSWRPSASAELIEPNPETDGGFPRPGSGLSGNRVTDLSPLSGLGTLRFLGLADNAVDDVTSLRVAASLEYLTIGGNPLTDITALGDLPQLLGVDLAGSTSVGIAGIEELRAQGIYVGGLA
jgi:hypothetical protein